MEERLPIWRVDAIILNKQSRAADKSWSSDLVVGRGANNSSPYLVTKNLQGKPRTWNNTSVRPKQRKGDMRFGTWNVRNLYSADSLTTAARKLLARNKLDLVGVQEVRWDKGGTVRAGILCTPQNSISS